MRIAVTTPTGNVGSHVVAMLIRAGVRPKVLARHPEKLSPEIRASADVVKVDQLNADSVVESTTGVDALYWVDPSTASEDPLADYARYTRSVVAAVTENNIGRVVFQSSLGAEKRHGAGEIDGLAGTELALDETPADVAHLRCGYFFSNLELQLDMVRPGTIQVVLPLDQPMAWVAPRDIAEVGVSRLLSTDWSGRQVQAVHGPADLTWTEAVEIVSAAIDRPLTVQQISDDHMRAGMLESGMPKKFVDAIMGMSTGLRDGFVAEQARTIQTTTPTTLGAWAYEILRPLV